MKKQIENYKIIISVKDEEIEKIKSCTKVARLILLESECEFESQENNNMKDYYNNTAKILNE